MEIIVKHTINYLKSRFINTKTIAVFYRFLLNIASYNRIRRYAKIP